MAEKKVKKFVFTVGDQAGDMWSKIFSAQFDPEGFLD